MCTYFKKWGKNLCAFAFLVFFTICIHVVKYAFSVQFSWHDMRILCFTDR